MDESVKPGMQAGQATAEEEDRIMFSRLVRDGKRYASEGELVKALRCLTVAYDIRATDRIKKHIDKIKAALDDDASSGGSDEDGPPNTAGDQQNASRGHLAARSQQTDEQYLVRSLQATSLGDEREVSTISERSRSRGHSVTASGGEDGGRGRGAAGEESASKPQKRTLLGRNIYVSKFDEAPQTSDTSTKLSARGRRDNAGLDGDDGAVDKKTRNGALATELAPNGAVLKSVWDKLYSHQRQGLDWLLGLHEKGFGGILADDMGLGKTVQITVYLASLVATGRIHSALVLAPVSVLTTWQNEIKRWYPSLRLGCFHGTSKKQREMDLERVQKRGGVCLTTYGMVRSGFDELTCRRTFCWDCLVLDEGHMIRNNNKTTKQIYELPAGQRLVLTGTPIMNRLEELWRLFDFVSKGNLFGPLKDFKENYESPIIQSHAKGSTEAEKENGSLVSEKLQRRIAPFMLRRTKAEVMAAQERREKAAESADTSEASAGAVGGTDQSESTTDASSTTAPACSSQDSGGNVVDCPVQRTSSSLKSQDGARMAKLGEKRDLIVWVHLSQAQLQLYVNFVTGSKVQEALMEQRSALPKLMLLKKITDHPALLSASEREQLVDGEDELDANPGYQGDYVESDSEDDVINDSSSQLGSQSLERGTSVVAKPWLRGSKESLVSTSGKLGVLLPLLQVLKTAGHRVLIFSQMSKMLDIIEAVLNWKGIRCLRLDGKVKKIADRQRIIDKFSTETKYTCFLLTTQVGGVGLTLTAADRVVIVDPSWNPAVDAQAVDRAYRIGQQRSVVVYRLITCGTIEEKIYRKQVFKDSVNQQVTGDSSQPLRYFTTHELHNLFMLDNPWQSSTQERLSQMENSQSTGHEWLQTHRQFFSSLGVVQGLSEHHLQLNVLTDEDFWDENKLEGDGHSELVLKKHKLMVRAKRNESNGVWERALLCLLQAVRLQPSDLRVQFRCLQLTAQLGLWK